MVGISSPLGAPDTLVAGAFGDTSLRLPWQAKHGEPQANLAGLEACDLQKRSEHLQEADLHDGRSAPRCANSTLAVFLREPLT